MVVIVFSFYCFKTQALQDGRGLSSSLNMLVTEQPKDHCVSKYISPNELLLHILSLTINIVSSVGMRERRWTRKQTQ